jgi:hypothetical protein
VCIPLDFKPIVPVSPFHPSLSTLRLPRLLVQTALLVCVDNLIAWAVAKQVPPNHDLFDNWICLTAAQPNVIYAELGQLCVVQLVKGDHGSDPVGKKTARKVSKAPTDQPDLKLNNLGRSRRAHAFVFAARVHPTRSPPSMKFLELYFSLRIKPWG